MFKLVLSLALIAACSANLYNNKQADYHINVGRDHIIVTNNYGYQVNFIIDRHSGVGEQIYVQVTGQGQVVENEQIVNEPVTLTGKYEADILYQVFDNFSGILDEATYQKLIHIVYKHVQDGHVHPIVLYALQMLANQQQSVELLDPSHQQYYNTVSGLFRQIGYYGQGYGYSGLGGYGSWYGVGKPSYGYGSWYGIGRPSSVYGNWYGIGKPSSVYGNWYGIGKPSSVYGNWYGIGKPSSGYGSWYGIGKPSYGYGSWYGIGKPSYSGVGGYGSWSGYGKQGLAVYGSWYGLGRQGYNYPGAYSPSWTQSYYGPYSSNVWNYPSQVYGYSGYGSRPYGGYWSQWQGAYPYQSELLVN